MGNYQTYQKIEKPVKKICVWTDKSNQLFGIQLFDKENKMILQTQYDCFNKIDLIMTKTLLLENERILGVRARKNNIYLNDFQFVIGAIISQ